MKQLYTILAVAIMLWSAISFTACDKSSGSDNPQITKTWSLGSAGFIKNDGVDVTSDYAGLTVTFSGNTYSTTNAHQIFRSNGTWIWSKPQTEITLDGDVPVTISTLTATSLRITFELSYEQAQGNGRTAAITGSYEILLHTAN